MKKFISLLLLFIIVGCTTKNQQPSENALIDTNKIEGPKLEEVMTITDKYYNYNLYFKIETTENNTQHLVVSIELKRGSHFISPHAKREFKGKLSISLASYDKLAFKEDLIETPRSIEEFDPHPFVNGLVNWVRVNTTYKQELNILSKDDFEVSGKVRFTIEPRCTLKEIPFTIYSKNGVMIVKYPKC